MIPQSLLNNYRKEVDQAGNEASKYIQAVVDTYRSQYPNASVSEIRDYTRDAMRDVLYLYGGQSALLSNDFFEEVARRNGEDLSTEIYETIDYDQADKKIRYFAKSLVTGDIADFDHSISELTKYYVKRQAFENLVKNCDKHGLRYARVPSGRETCAFCFMLASKGFVYWSEEEAGGMGHKFHSHCDCVIVPGFHKSSGVNEDEQIEGYKPSKLYERYQMCYNTINPDGTWNDLYEQWKKAETEDTWEQYKTHQLMAEINKRDTRWLWSGKIVKTDYSLQPKEKFGKVTKAGNYEKKYIKIGGKEWKDLWVHHVLEENGIKGVAQDTTNLDLTIRGQWWEIKSPETPKEQPREGKELGYVEDNIKKAVRQFRKRGIEDVRIIFNSRYRSGLGDDVVLDEIKRQIAKRPVKELIFINKEGKMIRVKN